MRTGPYDFSGFLHHVVGTELFLRYCAERRIPFLLQQENPRQKAGEQQWWEALHTLPEDEQARIERELAQVKALAHPDATALLLAGASGKGLPPDTIPQGAPLALWFFLHHPMLFREVFFHHEIAEVTAWRMATAPLGMVCHDLTTAQTALAESLRACFLDKEGVGRFCVVEAHPVRSAVCFLAYLSDRLHVQEVFTMDGQQTTHTTRPAVPLLFAYEPEAGRILLKTRLRAQDRILDLFQRFGRTVLGIELDAHALQPLFQLDLLKRHFDPPLEQDIHQVRVKALHLTYPAREGRRRIKLETLAGDSPVALVELLGQHGGERLEHLDVVYAELEVRFSWESSNKRYVIRLWPDRCNLDQTPLGERLFAYLARWGLTYAPEP